MHRRYVHHTQATTSIDYALIAVGISITIMAVAFTMGDTVSAMLTQAMDALNG